MKGYESLSADKTTTPEIVVKIKKVSRFASLFDCSSSYSKASGREHEMGDLKLISLISANFWRIRAPIGKLVHAQFPSQSRQSNENKMVASSDDDEVFGSYDSSGGTCTHI